LQPLCTAAYRRSSAAPRNPSIPGAPRCRRPAPTTQNPNSIVGRRRLTLPPAPLPSFTTAAFSLSGVRNLKLQPWWLPPSPIRCLVNGLGRRIVCYSASMTHRAKEFLKRKMQSLADFWVWIIKACVPDSSFEVEISCTHVLGTCPCYVCVKEGRKKHSTAQLLVRRYTRRMFTHTHTLSSGLLIHGTMKSICMSLSLESLLYCLLIHIYQNH
jgi:hypothetical protein